MFHRVVFVPCLVFSGLLLLVCPCTVSVVSKPFRLFFTRVFSFLGRVASATSSVDCFSLLYMLSMSSRGSVTQKRLRNATVKVSFISAFDVTSSLYLSWGWAWVSLMP